jgi:XTP/dITP diphosphohydrolase
MELIFGTHNQNKVEEINTLLPNHYCLKSLTELGHESEIEETGSSLEENALIKVRAIHNVYKKNTFAEDSGLEVLALKGAPGVYSARYAGIEKNAQHNMDKLLNKLKGIKNRQTQFRTIIALIFNEEEYLFEGVVKGNISIMAKGQNGFGYDPIFIPENKSLSFAEMSITEKNKISHRSRAFKKLVEFLKS